MSALAILCGLLSVKRSCAAIGMFKPGKHEHHHRRFHLRRKHRHGKHKHDDSHGTDESLPEEAAHPSAESSITDVSSI